MIDAAANESVSGESIADFALRLVREPSPSADEGRVAQLVEEEMRRLGYDVSVDDWGNVIGSIGRGTPCVLVDAHMDTVGVTQPQEWSHNPYGEIDGNRLFGRGSMDMKGPLASAIRGIATLRDRLEEGRVVVSATIAEELVEGTALLEVANNVEPDYVIICEATSLNVARGQRGRAELTVEVVGRPTHSSRPEFGINAAEVMVDVIRCLRGIPVPKHEILGQGILVLTDVMSHPYPGLSVVPDRCVATFDRRTLPGETEESILAPIRHLIAEAIRGSGATASVRIAVDDFVSYGGKNVTAPNFAAAWFFDDDELIVRESRKALVDSDIDARLGHYAFCTNGSGTAGRLGIPTIGFGPGDEAMAHRVDEFVDIADLERAAKGYAAIALALLEESQ
jgi:putative selenium metabolism hydrolase